MPPLPVISGKDFLNFLQALGFTIVRINGSHHRLKHPDGKIRIRRNFWGEAFIF
jgi:predicted RNA binding protein YcfA (HicA-like mRNA interferase family)